MPGARSARRPGIDAVTAAFGWTLEVHEAVTSTSDVLAARAVAGAPDGLAVLARRQTQGRGRAGRAWESPDGNLALSVLLNAAIAWRVPRHLDASTLRFALDTAHLSLWGLSAGPAAVAVIATTLNTWRQGLAPHWLVALAAIRC